MSPSISAAELRLRSERFALDREAHLLASVNDLICAIHGIANINGAPGLVLELVEGTTLKEKLESIKDPLVADVEARRRARTLRLRVSARKR